MRRARCRGQASIEALALVPIVAAAVLLVWQLAVLVRGSLLAQEHARAAALDARGHGLVQVASTVRVLALLPELAELRIRARAVVRAP